LLLLDIITNVLLIVLLGFYLRKRTKTTVSSSGTAASAVGKLNTAVTSIADARAKFEAIKAKVAEHVSGESEALRDEIHQLHAELEAEIVYAESHHTLLG
jgi:hypothetical protein